MSLGTILAVDDEPDILVALEDLFEDEYRILTTSRPGEALDILRVEPDIAVILSDQRMPGMTGDALLAEARSINDAQAILLTGYADISAVIGALNRGGIMGYVTKPWDPALLRSTVRNAFERYRLGRDLATERALLLGLLENSADAISFKDTRGRFVRLNNRKAALLGSAATSCIGRSEGDFVTSEAATAIAKADEAAIAEVAPREVTTAVGPVGAERWSSVTRVPIHGQQGIITHLATIERDVTEQRKLEARLRQSDKMQALGTLAGGIAHDFNNLLTAILGSLELAGPKVGDNPRLKRLLDNATGAAQRGSGLTKRLLSFSRPGETKPSAVSPNALISGMEDLFGRSLGGMVSVTTALDPQTPSVRIDREQLELAILNLCINARDAMPDGGAITIATRKTVIVGDPELGDGDYAVLTVSDDGVGIPPEILERVCEPFFTTKAVGQGTGLGLAMVFGLAQQAHGRLNISSEVGIGTKVELTLPRDDSAQAEGEAPDVPPEHRPVTNARVLVVDDDDEVRHVTASFLDDFGYSASEAKDGVAALAQLERESFDLVVADLAMPGMTGVELAGEVRSRHADLPVLILTGHADAVRIPPDLPVMTKPFESVELAARVSKLVAPSAGSSNQK